MSGGGGGSKDLMGKKFRWLNFGQIMHMAKFPSVVDPELCRKSSFSESFECSPTLKSCYTALSPSLIWIPPEISDPCRSGSDAGGLYFSLILNIFV